MMNGRDAAELMTAMQGEGYSVEDAGRIVERMGKGRHMDTNGSAVAIRGDTDIAPATFEGMLKQADVLVKSGLLPQEIKTPAAAVAVMLTGRELGIPVMQSFRSIYVVKGKPTLSAQLMGALILRDGHSYKIVKSTNEECVIEFRRASGQVYTHTFTLEDAKRAGLTNSQTWQNYPKAMLFSRCMSAGARAFMPDVIGGMYTPEEIASIPANGNIEVVDAVAAEPPVSAPGEAPAAQSAPAQPQPQPASHPAPEWQGQYWSWLAAFLKGRNVTEPPEAIYESLKAMGKVKPHLAEYSAIYLAQKDTIDGIKAMEAQHA